MCKRMWASTSLNPNNTSRLRYYGRLDVHANIRLEDGTVGKKCPYVHVLASTGTPQSIPRLSEQHLDVELLPHHDHTLPRLDFDKTD